MTLHRRRLIATWLILIGFTAAMALVADVRHDTRLGSMALMATAVVAAAKSWFVLADYLGLRRNRSALKSITTAIVVTLVVVAASFVAIGN